MLLALFTELIPLGGIQRMGHHYGAVFSRLAAALGQEFKAVTLNDAPGPHSIEVAGTRFSFTGFGKDKLRFSAAVARNMARADFAFIGHPHFAPLALTGAASFRPPRYWVQAYGVEVWTPLGPLHRLAMRRAERVIGLSRHTVEVLRTVQGVPGPLLELLPPALDPSLVPAAAAPFSVPGRQRLLTVSRLDAMEPYKGIENVLTAMKLLAPEFPGLSYELVGDGTDRPRLEAIAREVGVEDRVHFGGRMDGLPLRDAYRDCDIFVLPSLREGFGIVYLEAMAHGKPVIGVDCAGTRDVVRHDFNGVLIPRSGPQEIADAIAGLLRDPARRERLGRSGRAWIGNFSLDAFNQRVVDLYHKEAACASSM